jgi:hypothetical protein
MPQPSLAALLLSAAASDPAAVERALASVRSENICADVRFIAADELAGRDTPSPGQRLAARYLRARLERLGFRPGGDNGFFDEYKLTSTVLDREKSSLTALRGGEKTALAFGRDYFFFDDGVRELELAGGITSVGRGGPDDYASLDVQGRWVLALASEEVGFRERAHQAQAAGALGLITAPAPDQSDSDWWQGMEAKRSVVEGSEDSGSRRGSGLPMLWLSASGVEALVGAHAVPPPGTEVATEVRDRRVLGASEEVVLENVCGFWPGSDPALAKEVLILSAHYDHVGVQDGAIYNGADDNGSGTCGLLAVAEALKSYGPMRRSVLLLWVSGEEKGLWGSAAWTKNPTLPPGHRAVADINIDMIGRNAPEKLLITPTRELKEYNGLTRLAESLAPLEGFPVLGSCDDYWHRSDHMNFAENLRIPVAFLFSDVHEDYHEPTDDAEKIDCDKIRRVVRLVVRMLDGLQADALAL